jgi:hypothetical protein
VTRDLRDLGITLAVVVATWLAVGWHGGPIGVADETVTWIPYLQHGVAAPAWSEHRYSLAVVGGAPLHDTAGTLPLTQLCAALGLSATTTANLIILFAQVMLGLFGARIVAARAGRALVAHELVAAIWACAFVPALGFRLALGHENLVLGLVPLVIATALLIDQQTFASSPGLRPRHRSNDQQTFASSPGLRPRHCSNDPRPGPVMVTLGVLGVWHGLASVGTQLVVYGALFGAPVALVAAGRRWTPGHTRALLVLAAGALLVLPRLAPMIAHATGDDFPRGDASVVYGYGLAPGGTDWLRSLLWLAPPLADHELNFPLGPLALALVVAPRRIPLAMAIALATAIAFASGVPPFDRLAELPVLESFRVPARAVLPVLVLIPPFALGAWLARSGPATPSRDAWLWLVGGAAVIATARWVPAEAREVGAWLVAAAALARRVPAPAVAVIAALGAAAFADRRPVVAPGRDPATIRAGVLAAAPELAMPLHRVQFIDAPPPYDMSTAFAAGLSSLDGAWYPTRRFLELLGALAGKPVDPTTYVFQLGRTRSFPVLQQLYNVRYGLVGDRLIPLPEPPGPAWFVGAVAIADTPAQIAPALADPRSTAWLLRADAPVAPPLTGTCRVDDVAATDQRATIRVTAPAGAACFVVVATNYTAQLAATAGDTELATYPVDLALVGIAVPGGATEIVLTPRAAGGAWTWLALLAGVALTGLGAARARAVRSADRPDTG